MQSCNKTDKELAVEAVIEYTKSWNACTTMSPMRAEQFLDMLKATYNTIKNLELILGQVHPQLRWPRPTTPAQLSFVAE